MSIANCDQIAGLALGGAAIAGLGGASSLNRSPEEKGAIRVRRFSFTIPASGAGSVAADQIKLPGMKTTDRIYGIRVFAPALGANQTLAIGKIDTNNAANTDPNHYLAPTAVVNPGILDANINMTEQVGVDATGDETTSGNALSPSAGGGYGSGPIHPAITLSATPTTAAQILGFYLYAGDEP